MNKSTKDLMVLFAILILFLDLSPYVTEAIFFHQFPFEGGTWSKWIFKSTIGKTNIECASICMTDLEVISSN